MECRQLAAAVGCRSLLRRGRSARPRSKLRPHSGSKLRQSTLFPVRRGVVHERRCVRRKYPVQCPLRTLVARGVKDDVLVLRVENGFQRTYRFNLKRVLEGMEEPVFYLRPFDVVHVPAKAFNF